MQIFQAVDFKDRMELLAAPLNHILVNISFMIKYYCEYFDKSKKLFIQKYPEPNYVTLMVGIGAEKQIDTIFNI